MWLRRGWYDPISPSCAIMQRVPFTLAAAAEPFRWAAHLEGRIAYGIIRSSILDTIHNTYRK